MKKKKKKGKKRFRIKKLGILILLIFLTIISYGIITIYNFKITNIYIMNNNYLSDLQIIEIAKIKNYPSTFSNTSSTIKKRLEKNIYIKKAKVKKTYFTRVYIEVEENRPLFYTTKTILADGSEVDGYLDVPHLTNEVPNKTYKKLIKKMLDIDLNILNNISEIKYEPDEVDKERFVMTMNDGNYVCVTLSNLKEINNYLKYIKEFNNKKGILYLNSGEYFKIMEN